MSSTERPALRVRRCVPGDVDAMIDLFRASVRLVARRDYTHEQVTAWAPDEIDRGAWTIRFTGRTAWIAEIGGVSAGFADLEPDGHLDMMYVHPAHQGQGVATALLAQVESAARGLGLARIRTEASITARPFFERRGFRFIAMQTVFVRGQHFINFRLEKELC